MTFGKRSVVVGASLDDAGKYTIFNSTFRDDVEIGKKYEVEVDGKKHERVCGQAYEAKAYTPKDIQKERDENCSVEKARFYR